MKTMLIAASAALSIAISGAAVAADTAQPAAAAPAADANLVAVAKSSPQFRTLAKAIEAAGLEATLASGDGLTVFAPTDEAFARLPDGTLDNLMKPENREQLKQLLTNHVVPGYATAEFLSGQNGGIATVGGGTVVVDSTDGVTVSGAKVVVADVRASNGLIHGIDQVILPTGPVQATAAVAADEEQGSRPE